MTPFGNLWGPMGEGHPCNLDIPMTSGPRAAVHTVSGSSSHILRTGKPMTAQWLAISQTVTLRRLGQHRRMIWNALAPLLLFL